MKKEKIKKYRLIRKKYEKNKKKYGQKNMKKYEKSCVSIIG